MRIAPLLPGARERYLTPSYCLRAARTAAQRRFVASLIAFLPAALIFRFLHGGAVAVSVPEPAVRFAAHLFRWVAAILARTSAERVRRLFLGRGGPAPYRLNCHPTFAEARLSGRLCDSSVLESLQWRQP